MKRQWIGYVLWLLLAACLYFFENNTGTRIILIASALSVFVPFLRRYFVPFKAMDPSKESVPETVRAFVQEELDEPDEIRPYRTGDSIQLIHWKLSAKKDELLIRETVRRVTQKKPMLHTEPNPCSTNRVNRWPMILLLLFVFPMVMLYLIPEAKMGVQALCNRIFLASEAVNAYMYELFPVAESQSVTLAIVLLVIAAAMLIAAVCLFRSRLPALMLAAVLTLAQIYFGLTPPDWAVILMYTLLAIKMMIRPINRQGLPALCVCLIVVTLLVALFLPGIDSATESASETVRDHLSRLSEQITGSVHEDHPADSAARHVFTQSLITGDGEAQFSHTFRLETVEEEQISIPHWVNYLKIILLLLLTAMLLSLPFLPFLLINARQKKAREAQKVFYSENVNEAVCAIFQQIIQWMDLTGHGSANRLYREWTAYLPEMMPAGYAERFAVCAEDFERAVYSTHTLSEEQREHALILLKETAQTLYAAADRKKRLYLKYWMCMCE